MKYKAIFIAPKRGDRIVISLVDDLYKVGERPKEVVSFAVVPSLWGLFQAITKLSEECAGWRTLPVKLGRRYSETEEAIVIGSQPVNQAFKNVFLKKHWPRTIFVPDN